MPEPSMVSRARAAFAGQPPPVAATAAHAPPQGTAAPRQAAVAAPGPDTIAGKANALLNRTTGLLDAAMRDLQRGAGSVKDVTALLTQVRQTLELLGKLTGEIASGVSVQVVFAHPATRLFVESIVRHVCDVCGQEKAAEILARIEAEQRAALAAGSKH